jgi:hypothetical protein
MNTKLIKLLLLGSIATMVMTGCNSDKDSAKKTAKASAEKTVESVSKKADESNASSDAGTDCRIEPKQMTLDDKVIDGWRVFSYRTKEDCGTFEDQLMIGFSPSEGSTDKTKVVKAWLDDKNAQSAKNNLSLESDSDGFTSYVMNIDAADSDTAKQVTLEVETEQGQSFITTVLFTEWEAMGSGDGYECFSDGREDLPEQLVDGWKVTFSIFTQKCVGGELGDEGVFTNNLEAGVTPPEGSDDVSSVMRGWLGDADSDSMKVNMKGHTHGGPDWHYEMAIEVAEGDDVSQMTFEVETNKGKTFLVNTKIPELKTEPVK